MRLLTVGAVISGILAFSTPGLEAGSTVRTRVETPHIVTLPAGTTLPLVLDTSVGSDISRMEQPVHAHLARGLVMNGVTVLPRGTAVDGIVTSVRRPGKVKGRGYIAMRFVSVLVPGRSERYRLQTQTVARIAPATKEADAAKIALPAAGGAIVGALVGGGKGAAVGGAVGGGAGTAVVLSTRGKEVRVGRGAPVSARLTAPITVHVN